MMEGLLNQVRRAATEAGQANATTRHGTVSSYDPDNYAVKVLIQPEGVVTGWLPLKAVWIGNGWGFFAAPSIGDAVEVEFQEADGGVGSVGWRFFNDSERPLSVPTGELWIVHKHGQSIKLTTDGAVTLDDAQGAQIKLKGDGTISSAGNWTHSGTFKANDIELTTHVHKNVQAGSALSGGPQ